MTNVAEPSLLLAPKTIASHTSGHRGILLVEPYVALLNADASLLAQSNYSVTRAFSHQEVFALRATKTIALSVLSDRLGAQVLTAVARTIRKQWPLARILLTGRPKFMLEDHLYDEQIDHSSNPQQLLEDIEALYKDSWNQRSGTLEWMVKRPNNWAAQPSIVESDPIKIPRLGEAVERPMRHASSGPMQSQYR